MNASLLRSAAAGVRQTSQQTRSSVQMAGRIAAASKGQTRSFSALPRLRPTAGPSASIFRPFGVPTIAPSPAVDTVASPASSPSSSLDLVAASSISRHPALSGFASQIRCGPRPTLERSSRLIQKRRHGFLSRIKTKNGRKTIMRRRAKGRKKLAAL